MLVSVFGDGADAANSAALSSASLAGSLRVAELVFEGAGAGAASASLAPPYPTKSTTPAAVAQPVAQVRLAVADTSATLPAVADMLTPPVASAGGSD